MHHSIDEIEKKVFINEVLLSLGIKPKVIDNFVKKIYEYNMIRCKMCENLVANILEQKKKHISCFHKGQYLDEYYSLFDFSFGFKSETDFHLCEKCGTYMENTFAATILHENFTHSNLMENSQISIPMVFCHKCNTKCEEDHIHISFISTIKHDMELFNQYVIANQKDKGVDSEKNKLPIYYKMYKNMDSLSADLVIFKNEVQPTMGKVEGRKIFGIYSNRIDEPSLAVLTKFEVFSSVHRKIPILIDEKYNNLKSYIFDYSDFMFQDMHYFHKEPRSNSSFLIKRLKNEFDLFYDYIPFNYNSSFFVRADKNFPQFVKLLISGPRGSPYENGLYLFDVYFPSNYPNAPPKMRFMTTGDGSFRFNPNLDNFGRVCLSLIGGWTGNGLENWEPTKSNFAQVIIAITQFFFTDRIIESQPGIETLMQTAEGVYQNEGYGNIVRANNLTYAIIEQIKNYKYNVVFSDIIKEYFGIKAVEIVEDIKLWLKRACNTCAVYDGFTYSQNSHWAEILSFDEMSYQNIITSKLEELLFFLYSEGIVRRLI